ncbi:hypothetical protein GOZ97_16475 [Agrobacterium vitis]|uniref:hypothetical protein n=1 Tax=Rhizobium/Agrobacterium group TaxID=227290 RepID=UPI0008DC1B58|nr:MULTISPECIES: hypothetical protein [Rhizobium/Agrobacterium group]MCF1433187.1 hypothetical protein [Allorhizobium ampelinum]MUO91748.1 hypothetical protein [Agrobacterium vitis]MUZ54751.1 hypothetical protein [Agrobacterium vitis]MUZ93023.1 hypothetical protein [Agrobacterium vitis]MVA41455.1 hypothetical protein [Agrobacterium vitis]
MLHFDIIGALLKMFTPVLVVISAVSQLVQLSVKVFTREKQQSKVPAAMPLAQLRTPNLLDGLSENTLVGIRTRLSNGDAIRDDNIACLEVIDRRFGLTRSARTEYQDFKSSHPH